MSVPPEIIRVKRKRDDESIPVAFLQLDETTKRHCSGNWVYQRRDPEVQLANRIIRPVIHSSKAHGAPAEGKQHDDLAEATEAAAAQRQFFMSKASFTKISEARQGSVLENAASLDHAALATLQASEQSQSGEGHGSRNQEAKKLKRPGKLVRDQPRTSEAEKVDEPPTLPQYHHDMERLASEMGAWTMNEIQRNLDQRGSQSSNQRPVPKPAGARSTPSLKPKVPAQRYAERHPQAKAAVPVASTPSQGRTPSGQKAEDALDTEMDMDGDWIEEIYQRVPASKLDATVPLKDVGVIRFEDDKEEQFFYGAGDGDSDAEQWEDEEDENAEDYYGADYPEDEVDADDEFDRNAYKYRTGNASDEEEYDLQDYNDAEDEFNEYEDEDGNGHIVSGEDPEIAIRKIRQFLSKHRNGGVH
ncbi:unnamed protein product [Parascedosporium putredinis]|uniref:Transcription factor Iwr1 domain-containing protein n=1 Tax=Parascedosporium putredinis TaxID=1442378 RepID=A0A9P1H9Z9_9PEZI|nr:unnamed protein product [Parascedosporium putredinis]CAI8000912.1 unnamed protein product [Parascedosporium putredinis]